MTQVNNLAKNSKLMFDWYLCFFVFKLHRVLNRQIIVQLQRTRTSLTKTTLKTTAGVLRWSASDKLYMTLIHLLFLDQLAVGITWFLKRNTKILAQMWSLTRPVLGTGGRRWLCRGRTSSMFSFLSRELLYASDCTAEIKMTVRKWSRFYQMVIKQGQLT